MDFQFSLKGKLLCTIAVLLTVFCVLLSIYLKTIFTERFTDELIERGRSIVRNLAELSAGAFIEQDFDHLNDIARAHRAKEKDLVYVLMLNPNHQIVGHSFEDGYPSGLDEIKHDNIGGKISIQKIQFGTSLLYDISIAVLDARIGFIRVGLSIDSALATANSMVRQISTATVLLCIILFVLSLPILRRITLPIYSLTNAARLITQGTWDVQLPATCNDEIGRLTVAFKKMINTVHESELTLSAHSAFLQTLIDDIPMPVFYSDANSMMLGCNRAFTNLFGKPAEEIVGKSITELYNLEDAALHLGKDREIVARQEPLSYESEITDAKGQTREVVYSKAYYRDGQGQPAGVIGVILDMTEQRRIDHMKSEFVSTVAHEFQTPLAAIFGFTELIKDNVIPEKDREEAFAMILKKAEALSEMVDELLDLARIETGKGLRLNFETCEACGLLQKLLNNFSSRTPSHRFALNVSREPVTVIADTVKLGQVLENLLSNAVKYSEPGSLVKIIVTSDSNNCQVKVLDEGIGIKPYHLDKVFDRYYRVDSSNTAPAGTGLGLFICKSIIEAHRGHIDIYSVPGEGTTVTFSLPLAAQDNSQ